jgi:hypothetical protein
MKSAKPDADLAAAVEGLSSDAARLALALKALLEYSRVRVIGGWRRDRCRACDVPHVPYRACPCPHHQAVALLKELGIDAEV